MRYFYIEPEVGGGLGPHSEVDNGTHPPIVSKLNYEFDVWLGDILLEGFPCWIVTIAAMNQIKKERLTGAVFSEVEITKSKEFHELLPNMHLPDFAWLKVVGEAGRDDFGLLTHVHAPISEPPIDPKNYMLVVSERALDNLRNLGIEHAIVSNFSALPASSN
jgi:hypothetical protein